MICPIGVPGIVDKAPASIAVAVCAQLMQVRAHLAAPAQFGAASSSPFVATVA
jgi:xanthine/CO dehydrogenase XdhC/CoxF family maturation factor